MTKEEKTAIEGLVEEMKTLHKDMLILNKRVNYILTQVQLANAMSINKTLAQPFEDSGDAATNYFMDIQEDYEKILKKRAIEKFKALSKSLKEKETEETNNEKV